MYFVAFASCIWDVSDGIELINIMRKHMTGVSRTKKKVVFKTDVL